MSEIEKHIDEKDNKFLKGLMIGDDVSTPMQRHAAKVCQLGFMLAETEVELDRSKSKLDTVEKNLMKSFRNLDKTNKRKSTESSLTEKAQTHTLYLEAQENFFTVKKLHLIVKAKYKAQLEKGTMLTQLAQHRRKEIDAGIRSTLKKSE